MSLEGERDDRAPPAASDSWSRASWMRSEEFTEYRCAGQRAMRNEDSAAPWVPGELPLLPAAKTRAARKPRTAKKEDGEILRAILGTWAILCVALYALVSLIERDRPDLLSYGNPFAVGVICGASLLCFSSASLG